MCGDGVGVELGVHGDAREDAEFGARVEAVDVGGGVSLGVAELLRVGKDSGVLGAGLHAAENVVAGAVDDAAETRDLVTAEALQHAGDDRHSTGDCSAVDKMDAMLLSQFSQRSSTVSNKLLVRCDDGLAGRDRLAQPALNWIEAAHQLDDDVYVGLEDYVDVLRPHGVLGNSLCRERVALALDVAVKDMGKLNAGKLRCREHCRDRAAYGPEA